MRPHTQTLPIFTRYRLLSLLGLWTLAIPQPILNLIEQNPAFLVAHSMSPSAVTIFAVALIAIPPLALFGLEWIVNRWLRRATSWVLSGHNFLLFTLILLPYIQGIPWAPAVIIAALLGSSLLTITYLRWPLLPQITALLSLSALVVGGLFLSAEGVPTSLKPRLAPRFHSGGQHSVSILILDELSLVSLMNEREEIDADLFPNFAALAAGSTWYRNAISPAVITEVALPAILTGAIPPRGSIATVAQHPSNLFTLLGDYELYAEEPITLLCPQERNRLSSSLSTPWVSLGFDLIVVSGHLLLPRNWTARLPAIDKNWGGFWRPNFHKKALGMLGTDRKEGFRDFLEKMPENEGPHLLFLHSLLPHFPWTYYADGSRYVFTGGLPGLKDERWTDNPHLVEIGRRRYRQQLQMVDTLVGEWMERQKSLGLWDDAVVALMADHGISFKAGDSRRRLTEGNSAEILNVPCFIKAPGQQKGRIADRPFSLLEILGEVLRLAEVTDSIQAKVPPTTPQPKVWHARKVLEISPQLGQQRRQDLNRRLSLYPPGDKRPEWNHHSFLKPFFGTPVADLPLGPPLESVEIFIDDFDQFHHIGANLEEKPFLVFGQARGLPEQPGTLLMAVDGVLQTSLAVEPVNDQDRLFALLSPEILTEGDHEYSFFLARFEEASPLFFPIPQPSARWSLTLEKGLPVNLRWGDRIYPIRKDDSKGSIGVRPKRRGMMIHGWAWDSLQDRPVDRVVFFAKDHFLTSTFINGSSPEAMKALRKSTPISSGFQLFLEPTNRPLLRENPLIYAFAITTDHEAIPLNEGIRLVTDPICEGLTIAPDQKSLVRQGSSSIPFSSKKFVSWIDTFKKAENRGYGYTLKGWSVDEKLLQPADHLLVFHQNRCVYEVRSFHQRIDVVNRFQSSGVSHSGFYFWLDIKDLQADSLRVVAVSPRGIAQELRNKRP